MLILLQYGWLWTTTANARPTPAPEERGQKGK
nr:MAG TPA: hypothetical protein [Caudoviricetes sp.]